MKSELTEKIEKCLYRSTVKQGIFGCFEVTIGWYGRERVDYMTMDTNEVFRCYEIKVSKGDFYSRNAHTFIGHYNYFLMPYDLYIAVEKDIPEHIGVYVYYVHEKSGRDWIENIRKAKRQEIDNQTLSVMKNSMIRSLSREAEKFYSSKDENVFLSQKSKMSQMKRALSSSQYELKSIKKEVEEICGHGWNRDGSPCTECHKVDDWMGMRHLAIEILHWLKKDSQHYENIAEVLSCHYDLNGFRKTMKPYEGIVAILEGHSLCQKEFEFSKPLDSEPLRKEFDEYEKNSYGYDWLKKCVKDMDMPDVYNESFQKFEKEKVNLLKKMEEIHIGNMQKIYELKTTAPKVK